MICELDAVAAHLYELDEGHLRHIFETFHITHIDNIPWILKNGLHCANSTTVDPSFRAIGNADLIS